ncbi:lipoate--protein ligase [Candidatus Paracaedimonas acanthamoebae]|nr:lipoate--protein ligase [Candidatus Paracaedimonas acanthamoebae]
MQFKKHTDTQIPKWTRLKGLTSYPLALQMMEESVEKILCEQGEEQIFLLEHPALYTAGASAKPQELLRGDSFPVYDARRGGKYTYHGPGQRIVYIMLDLRQRMKDVRAFVRALEEWVIQSLRILDVHCERREGRIGLWVEHQGAEKKIAAIGIRLRQWISFHGIAINVAPDLNHYQGIIPCGIQEYGVTSLRALGSEASLEDLDQALYTTFGNIF